MPAVHRITLHTRLSLLAKLRYARAWIKARQLFQTFGLGCFFLQEDQGSITSLLSETGVV